MPSFIFIFHIQLSDVHEIYLHAYAYVSEIRLLLHLATYCKWLVEQHKVVLQTTNMTDDTAQIKIQCRLKLYVYMGVCVYLYVRILTFLPSFIILAAQHLLLSYSLHRYRQTKC